MQGQKSHLVPAQRPPYHFLKDGSPLWAYRSLRSSSVPEGLNQHGIHFISILRDAQFSHREPRKAKLDRLLFQTESSLFLLVQFLMLLDWQPLSFTGPANVGELVQPG